MRKINILLTVIFLVAAGISTSCKRDTAEEAKFGIMVQTEIDATRQKVLGYESTTIGIGNLFSAAVGKGGTATDNPAAAQIVGLQKTIEDASQVFEQKLPALQQVLDQYRAGSTSFSQLKSTYESTSAELKSMFEKLDQAKATYESLSGGAPVPNSGAEQR